MLAVTVSKTWIQNRDQSMIIHSDNMVAVNDKSTQDLLTAFKYHLVVSGDYSKVSLSLLFVHFLAGVHEKLDTKVSMICSSMVLSSVCICGLEKRRNKAGRENVSAMLQYNVCTLLSSSCYL